MNQLSFCTLFVSVIDKLVSILPYQRKPQSLSGFSFEGACYSPFTSLMEYLFSVHGEALQIHMFFQIFPDLPAVGLS